MSGGSGAFESGDLASWLGATPKVQGSLTPTAQPGTTPAWQTAAQPQVMQPNPNPYAPPTPANMPPPVTNMGPGVNAAAGWAPPGGWSSMTQEVKSPQEQQRIRDANIASNGAWTQQPAQQQPQQPAPQAPQGGIGGLAQPTQQPSYNVVQPYQQPQPQAPAFGGAYTQKYYNRS